MFKKRLFAALTAAAMALGMLTGCGGTGNSGSAADGSTGGDASAGGDVRLGVIFKTLSNPFYITMQEGLRKPRRNSAIKPSCRRRNWKVIAKSRCRSWKTSSPSRWTPLS